MASSPHSIAAFTFLLAVPFSWSQNLVLNSTFESDVAGWTTGATAVIVWNPLDADGNPLSGSAVVTNLSTTPGDSTGARQCIDGIAGGEFYQTAADILVPGGQSETGMANLLVQWYPEPACSGSQLANSSTPWIDDATPDVWLNSSALLQAPSGARSARLRLSVAKDQDSGTLDAHFDNVAFAKEQIFGDDFESSDASAWSSVVGNN